MDVLHACCAGLDVHKKTVVACVLRVDPAGKVSKSIKTFATMTANLLDLSDWLAAQGVKVVAMESTGSYWKPVFNLLEPRFEVVLVNAHHIKQVPGRKTDVRDSEWIAQLLQHGLLRPSFIPPRPIRELRDLTRQRTQLINERTAVINRIQKVLEDANVKLGSVASNALGVSGRLMIEAIIRGEYDLVKLADLARSRLRKKIPDGDSADLYPGRGQPALPPWRLALVTVMQLAEDLSDRQATDAVRRRIDWKSALGLELDHPGSDFSVLGEFRGRLTAGGAERLRLEQLLEACQARHLLEARGRQRTDSTHVLAAARALNRLELVGETLRAARNAVAAVAPDWLCEQATPAWYDRYAARLEETGLPKGREARSAYAEVIGGDGHRLLEALRRDATAAWLWQQVPAVAVLRRVWLGQFHVEDGRVRWRTAADLAPAGRPINSPYDPEATFGNKRSATWVGYKV